MSTVDEGRCLEFCRWLVVRFNTPLNMGQNEQPGSHTIEQEPVDFGRWQG